MGFVVGRDQMDIFGNYFMIDTSKRGQKYSIKPAEEAAEFLRVSNSESLREIRSQYLTYVSNICIKHQSVYTRREHTSFKKKS